MLAGTGVNNTIHGGSGTDILVGADGSAALNAWRLTSFTSTDPNFGGTGTLTGGTGTDLIIGGKGNYKITGDRHTTTCSSARVPR